MMFYNNNVNIPSACRNIVFINVLVYVMTFIAEYFLKTTVITEKFALFFPLSHYFKWWQPLTYMFVHGGFFHILFNMYTLVMFGSVMERVMGSRKFLLFYLLCGLGAAGAHIGVQFLQLRLQMGGVGIPTVGASGAIYGVLIGYIMLFPDSKLMLLIPPVAFKAKILVWIFVGIEIFMGVFASRDGIAHFAHLGGMLAGWLIILIWRKTGTLFDKEW